MTMIDPERHQVHTTRWAMDLLEIVVAKSRLNNFEDIGKCQRSQFIVNDTPHHAGDNFCMKTIHPELHMLQNGHEIIVAVL